MEIKKRIRYAVYGWITGFFAMYGYLSSYAFLGKFFGDGTPYFLAVVGLFVGLGLSFVDKRIAGYIAIPIWVSVILGFTTLFILSAFQLDNISLNFMSPFITFTGIILGLLISWRISRLK